MEIAKEQVHTIVKNINRLCTERHMTKGRFYKEVGISSAGFSQWNVGATVPTVQNLFKIAEILDVELGELLYDRDKQAEIKKESAQKDELRERFNYILDNIDKDKLLQLLKIAETFADSLPGSKE